MTKEKYEEYIQNTHDNTLNGIVGLHEFGDILKYLDYYIVESIEILEKIYNDKDISFNDYMYLTEKLSRLNKEMFRIVMR